MSARLSLTVLGLLMATTASAAKMNVACILRGSCIDSQKIVKHLEKLQNIAVANNNNRAAGTTGHELSANYVAQQLLGAGYKVDLLPFSFIKFIKVSASLNAFEEGKDFNVMNYSGSGSVAAQVSPIDVQLGAGNTSTSGCESADFATFPKGNIALIQRGTCPFAQKVEAAVAAGASGVIMFNQGNTSEREAIFLGNLSEGTAVSVPVFATSYPFAVALMEQADLSVQMDAVTKVDKKISYTVLAETKTGNPDNVVMLGAHLDSVPEGPGINDNASGSAAILEIALGMKDIKPIIKFDLPGLVQKKSV